MKRVLTVFGTRPEAIKMAPLANTLKNNKGLDSRVCVTGQHREMLDQVLELFEIKPDYDLNLMQQRQTLSNLTQVILSKIRPVLIDFKPDLVLVHGDTTTTLATALAAYYEKIDVGHIEAGLRTGNIYSPWPEEINRKLVSSIAKYHFAPTKKAESNLILENIPAHNIYVTGNTVIDALMSVRLKLREDKSVANQARALLKGVDFSKKLILVTGHRRENLGAGFESICYALTEIALKRHDCQIIYPVHRSPDVRDTVITMLKNSENILLIEPLSYLPFIYLMDKSHIVLTDSGGIQEEAPALGKPVLLMRNTTERPEAVDAGTVKIIGTATKKIVSAVTELLENEFKYDEISKIKNPYGDGTSSAKILKILLEKLN
jgi:UDP-N-acetylglucosamine 2-epimerase (non-hydrolysing)